MARRLPDQIEALLEPFRFTAEGEEAARLVQQLEAGAPPPPADPGGQPAGGLQVKLAERAEAIQAVFRDWYRSCRADLLGRATRVGHAYEVLHAHTRMMDALHRQAFVFACDDLPALLALRREEWRAEQEHCRAQHRDKSARLVEFRKRLAHTAPDGEAERQYYLEIENGLERECAELGRRSEALEAQLTAADGFAGDREELSQRLVLFARGGYGRAELGLASDLDTGYCVDPRGLPPGGLEPYREVVLRTESLLRGAGLETAHQYFELDEDLSRFMMQEAQHTISSVLEGRALLGSGELLLALQKRFRDLLPFERYAARKLHELQHLGQPGAEGFRLKTDAGGLRTVQVPLWLIAHGESLADWSTAAILAHGVTTGMISVQEAERLGQGLELLQDLRNAIAPAGESASGFGASPDRLDAERIRQYLERRERFADGDRFDRHLRRLTADLRTVSARLVARVLDRTATHAVGPFLATVHLHRDEIMALEMASGDVPMESRLGDLTALLEVLAYVSESGHRLSAELMEHIGEQVPGMAEGLRVVDEPLLHRILSGPFAHRAIGALFAVNAPVPDGVATLMGRVLPFCDRAHFLARGGAPGGLPLHERMVAALEVGARQLDSFRETYPEWADLIGPDRICALKWSLFLHPLGLIESEGAEHARSAELAGDLLDAMAAPDAARGTLVRLLVEGQEDLVHLTQGAQFVDLALAEYFELAQRDVATAILLYVVNVAVYEARESVPGAELDDLAGFFDEAMRILASLRVMPASERTIELINLYFDARKAETERETRLHLLALRVQTQGPAVALRAQPPPRAARPPGEPTETEGALAEVVRQLEPLYRRIVLGRHAAGERERLMTRLVHTLGQTLGEPTVERLTQDTALSWFFAAFPNRYLLRTPPALLAQQIVKFSDYRRRQVLVEHVSLREGIPETVLIAARGLERPHSRVAYALALRRYNILSGKVNRVLFPDGGIGFCYWFQMSPVLAEIAHSSGDLETLILQTPPDAARLRMAVPRSVGHATDVQFLPDDGRGYRVSHRDGAYRREPMPFGQVRVMRHDEPFLFHGLCHVFDGHGVELQQAVITTSGNLVTDTFFLKPEDWTELARGSIADEILAELDAPLPPSETAPA